MSQKIRRYLNPQDYELIQKINSNPELKNRVNELSSNFQSFKAEDILLETLDIPESIPDEDYILDFRGYRGNLIGIIGDIHVPYHDVKALKKVLAHFYNSQIGVLLLNGDILDMGSISTHLPKKNQPKIKYEIETTKAILKEIRKVFPHIPIIFKSGNHEEKRLEKYLLTHARELAELVEIELPTLLGLKEFDIQYVHEYEIMDFGNIVGIHGHEVKVSGKNVAMSGLDKLKTSFFSNHFHRSDNARTNDLKGNRLEAHVLGCMCNLKPSYHPFNTWNLGFAEMYLKHDLSYEFFNYEIDNTSYNFKVFS